MKKIAWVTAISILSSISAIVGSSSAQAITLNERNDAGELLNTAQTIRQGGQPLESISGSLSGDADLFKIFLTGGQTFSATTLNLDTLIGIPSDDLLGIPTDLLTDPQLFLFNSEGVGIYANDDLSFSLQSALPSAVPFTPTESGIYYLAISGSGYDPFSTAGNIFPDDLTGDAFEPTGTGGSLPLSEFRGTSSSGRYTIALTGVQTGTESIPEPTSVLGILALGAWGTVQQLKRKAKINNSAEF